MATTANMTEIVAIKKKAAVCIHSCAVTPPMGSVTRVTTKFRQPAINSIQALIDARALKIGGIPSLLLSTFRLNLTRIIALVVKYLSL